MVDVRFFTDYRNCLGNGRVKLISCGTLTKHLKTFSYEKNQFSFNHDDGSTFFA
jgi:hypothetical protein